MIEVTDEMVERAAKILHRSYASEFQISDWPDLSAFDKASFLDDARDILNAALNP